MLTAHRVTAVVTARHSVVLRLRDPDDLVDVDIGVIAGHPSTPDEAAAHLHHWLQQINRTDIRWPRRPSPSLAPPALLLLTLAASALHNL